MKKFILKVSIFLIILIAFFSINFFINQLIIRNTSVNIDNKKIFVGDSHIQNAINPEFLPGSINIAQPAEPYILTYWKLKNVLESNQGVKVILGFAPHNIAKFNDYKLSDSKWASEMFSRSYSIQEFNTIKNEIDIDYKEYYKTLFKIFCFYPHFNHTSYIGNFSNSTNNKIDDFEETINRHFYYKSNRTDISELSIKYLDSIVLLISNSQNKLILLNTPVHSNYANRVPKKIYNKYNILIENYKSNNITIIDKFATDYNDSLFLNVDHLNIYGAKMFSIELDSLIAEIK
ncbi:hypothetical protein K8089_12160 [Aequorivita sp. F47161]|uniref:DUF1574 domain-containing protein n=1 Tax=Aequorivita vitellina TaxID=2874475 RepID=A0A9X1U3P9_9FLAO|nr:hypothetical protein [Aequorivita vitellina]MCG2419778.1 hypothetical protein [Aequorivita vitellina]